MFSSTASYREKCTAEVGLAAIASIVPGNTASAALAEIGGTSVGSFINNGQVIIQASLGPMAGLATDQFGRKW